MNERLIIAIGEIALPYAVSKIVLFGSRARSDNKPTSDIDLAVFPLPEFNEKGRLSSELDDLETLLKIDIVFINENTDPRLLENIKKEGVLIYERSRTKLENFSNALTRLQEGVIKLDPSNDLLRDGLIQRFEFAFELAWKTLKACFEEEGLTGLNSPKTVLREAFSAGLIEDDEVWLAMLKDRNSTAHIYSEALAIEITNHIQDQYIPALDQLIKQINKRLTIHLSLGDRPPD